jgi:hypothetical protein
MITLPLTSTGKRYGTHGSTLAVDATGKKFLVKDQDHFRTVLDVTIAHLGNRLGLPQPAVHEVDGLAAHEWCEGASDAFTGAARWHVDPATLSEADLDYLAVSADFDWLISNHDSHPGQFLRLADGSLMGIDKGQAFRYFANDRRSPDFHPNASYGEAEPIYCELLRRGLLTTPRASVLAFRARLAAMTDDEYRAILLPYAQAACEAGRLAYGTVAAFLDAAVARKHEVQGN